MNVEQIKKEACQRSKLPPLEVELILAYALRKSREFVLTHPEKNLTRTQISNFKLQVSRRLKGLPIAYITGQKHFYGLDFKVTNSVLIPRPETELMVDEALALLRSMLRSRPTAAKSPKTPAGPQSGLRGNVNIIDIGTGSGCVIISLVKTLLSGSSKNLKADKRLPDFKFFATDISRPALTVARHNAKTHNVSKPINFFHGNLLDPIIKFSTFDIRHSTFVILANLPYLTPADIKSSPTIRHEPRLALVAGADGLKYYRQLFKQINRIIQITNHQSPITIFCEIDPSQTKKIKQLIKNELPKSSVQIKKDLRGHNRLVVINII